MAFGNFLGNLMNLVPGYYQGRQQAIKDNWQDLSNYNQVQRGQLDNLFNMATFEPRAKLPFQQAQLGDYQIAGADRANTLAETQFPTAMTEAATQSLFAPELARKKTYATLNQMDLAAQLTPVQLWALLQMYSNPSRGAGAYFPGMPGGSYFPNPYGGV